MGRSRSKPNGARRLRWTVGVLAVLTIWVLWPDDTLEVEDDDEALARVIQSEIGTGTVQQQRHVAWSVRNLARERKQSIAAMVCSPCGPQMRGRPVSSRQAATDTQRRIARRVLAKPAGQDPTGGATHFLNPQLQDALARSGKRRGYRGNTYRKVRKRWKRSYGWEPYYRIGETLELWGPKKKKKKRQRKKRQR